MSKTYYDICGAIDQHNRQRQAKLELEHYIWTEDWWKRVALGIDSMAYIDARNIHQALLVRNVIQIIITGSRRLQRR